MLWDYEYTSSVRAKGRGAGKGGPMSEGSVKSPEELAQELEKLKAENASLKKARNAGVSFKVSEKGAVSVYGLGRFPGDALQGAVGPPANGPATRSGRLWPDNADRLKVKE